MHLHNYSNIKKIFVHIEQPPSNIVPTINYQLSTNSTMNEDFKKEYTNMFFKQLDKAITHNSISLEIEKGALSNIILQVENHLISIQSLVHPEVIPYN